MNKKTVYILWGALFIVCAALGFIPDPKGITRTLLFLLSLLFFLPPALLLLKSAKDRDEHTLKLIRNLSGLSLLVTLILILLNILSVRWPVMAGNILNSILTIVSSPMLCCGNWFLSMFLWACLLMISLKLLKK